MSRIKRLFAFSLVGASGIPINAAVMWALHAAGMWYVAAAVIATQVAIAWNLALSESVVFKDRRDSLSLQSRARRYFAINNLDTLARVPLLAFLVETVGLRPSPANLFLIVAASGFKYLVLSKVVYRPLAAARAAERTTPTPARAIEAS